MENTNFFIEYKRAEEDGGRATPLIRNLLILSISLLYGIIAILVAVYFLEMSSITIFILVSIYAYGILGGFAILMLIKLFNRAEENTKMLLNVLDYDNNPHSITNSDGKYLYKNKAWQNIFGDVGEVSCKNISVIFEKPHIVQQQLQIYLTKINQENNNKNAKDNKFLYIGKKKHSGKILKLSVDNLPNWKDCQKWYLTDITNEQKDANILNNNISILDDFSLALGQVNDCGELCFYNNELANLLKLKKNKKYYLHDIFNIDANIPAYAICAVDASSKSLQVQVCKLSNGQKILAVNSISKNREGKNIAFISAIPVTIFSNIVGDIIKNKSDAGAFKDIFVDAPLGICVVSSNMTIVKSNTAFKRLVEKDEINNISILDLISKEQHKTLQRWLELVLDNSNDYPTSIEVNLIQKAGHVATRIYVHRFEKDEVALYFIDLTQEKNLEQQFTQSQKMQGIGQLAGGIAHDFNNLLTAMIGFCDLLLLRHKPGDPSFSDIMQIKQNANRAANLVRQLLAFSRQQTLQPKILDITDVLSDLMHLMQRLIGTNINLDIQHGQNLWPVKCDEGQLEQVIINLVVNARDAMKDGGELEILTDNYTNTNLLQLNEDEYLPVGDWVTIKVKDTGTGIEPEILSRIFEPFFSTKEIGAGTGLGLSTVHGIIHQTGGFLGVESEVGKGTIFTIYLPKHIENKENNDEDLDSIEKEKSTDTTTEDLTGTAAIMLVEDEDAVRIFSSRALSNKGYKIIDAPNGEEAMKIIEGKDIKLELLITDIIMPEMDGPSLAKNIRRIYPDLKIIFMSGYSEDRIKEEFGDNTYFLQKPFTLTVLAKMVKDVLDS